mmetsp:Transcript_60140/g.68470  ORF Transcript_60140/g.68470 Transcript_60140/m.68470 type:complete len:89 (+) Transcript_60140:428-694(+)
MNIPAKIGSPIPQIKIPGRAIPKVHNLCSLVQHLIDVSRSKNGRSPPNSLQLNIEKLYRIITAWIKKNTITKEEINPTCLFLTKFLLM